MLAEFLQERAALYAAGAMTAREREEFELVLDFHAELRAHVAGLQETAAGVLMAGLPVATLTPPAGLRERLLEQAATPWTPEPTEARVATDADGRIVWVNAAFTAMCGHALSELKGRKPGEVLQGPDTDAAAVARIRAAVHAGRACRETLVNYHKDGSRYRVDIRITPVLDDAQRPVWFVARERKLD